MSNIVSVNKEVNKYSPNSNIVDISAPVNPLIALDGTRVVPPRFGYWALCRKDASGHMHQSMHSRQELEAQILQTIQLRSGAANDIYISQGFFAMSKGGGVNRRAINVCALTHAYVDLDVYKLGCWVDQTNHDVVVKHLRTFCEDVGLPPPTSIIFSGRGYYVKWAFKNFIPRPAAARFVACLKELVRRCEWLGADPMATDVSRVLRLVHSRHSGSGREVALIWDDPSAVYSFDEFADTVLPYTMDEIRQFRAEAKVRKAEVRSLGQERQRRMETRSPRGQADFASWHWGVLGDLQTISGSRWDGLVPEGYRDLYGFLGACSLAQSMPAHTLPDEIRTWGAQVGIEPGFHDELVRSCASLIDRAERDARHEPGVVWNGREKPWKYAYRKDTLIDMLQITSDEMAALTCLIDRDEKNRRRMAKRRAEGVQPREEYEVQSLSRKKPWEAAGISRRTWERRRALKE